MRWIVGILINAILFIAIAGFLDESFYVSSFGAAIGASAILSILNILVRPILIILTLPITFLTLGLFLFVVNAFTLRITDDIMGKSFEISSFGITILVAFIMSVANLIIQKAIFERSKEK
ncbi:phage holin family protein [Cytobacillus dafuensis]|uniref:Phage holin family protein n=1 Tax=Cytobacillus dafuensis TaxID=1742359 RepID=A0A5B8Z8V8_CYTDA|nr:phage holin family protein [Cytobacillus dafuensis]QED49545.1 phage holin family protein [Cytobacillus dafuensis]